MEINPDHTIIQELKRRNDENRIDEAVKDYIWLLFYTASISAGSYPEDRSDLGNKVYQRILCLNSFSYTTNEEGDNCETNFDCVD